MTQVQIPRAELVTIGDELLLGRTSDTNAGHIARRLCEAGFDLRRKTTVGDAVDDIAEVVRQAASRADLVLTTGGLGPTADDPTREALARAAGVALEYRAELWEQVEATFARFGSQPSENNRQQAWLPAGAIAIPNPVGTAPAFRLALSGAAVIALPGVPREMKHLLDQAVLPWLRQRFDLSGAIRVRLLRTAGVGESRIDERIRDLEELGNPDVGLAAHAGQVDIRITARAASAAEAAALLEPVEAEIRQRLGPWIFGSDDQSLAGALLQRLSAKGWRLASLESGTRGGLAGALSAEPASAALLARCELRSDRLSLPELATALAALREATGAEAALGISIVDGTEASTGHFLLLTPEQERQRSIPHGGHPALAAERAVHFAMEMARRQL